MSEGFTIDALVWEPRIPALTPETASEEQWAVLVRTGKAESASPYSKTLAHDPDSLEARAALYDRVMYSDGGLPKPDRELAALVVSMTNACRYCASVHGRRLAQLTTDRPAVRALLDGAAPETARSRGISAFATDLTTDVAAVGPDDVTALAEAGLDELEIFDLIQVVAMFAWANRLMLGLGSSRAAPRPSAVAGARE